MNLGPQTGKVPEGAGFVERFIAMLIDGLILAIPLFIAYYILPIFIGWLLGVVGAAAYAIYFWTSSGATPGKMVMKLKVVNAETGALLEPAEAVLRYVGYLASSLPFYLGFIWVLFDPNKEAWHDKIAKTRVIKSE